MKRRLPTKLIKTFGTRSAVVLSADWTTQQRIRHRLRYRCGTLTTRTSRTKRAASLKNPQFRDGPATIYYSANESEWQSARVDTPQGAIHWEPVATRWENRPQDTCTFKRYPNPSGVKRILPVDKAFPPTSPTTECVAQKPSNRQANATLLQCACHLHVIQYSRSRC